MNINKEAVEAILDAVEIIVKNRLKSVKFDVSKRGRITEILEKQRYKVEIKGTVYTVPCCIERGFSVGDVVWIKFPEGNLTDGHIYGKA